MLNSGQRNGDIRAAYTLFRTQLGPNKRHVSNSSFRPWRLRPDRESHAARQLRIDCWRERGSRHRCRRKRGHCSEIQELAAKLTDVPIRYLINTNYHGDHTFGNYAFPDSVEIIAHRLTADSMPDLDYEKRFAGGTCMETSRQSQTSSAGVNRTARSKANSKSI
jgi:hypothetical protein